MKPSPFRDRVVNGVIERFSRCCKAWLVITEFRRAPIVKHGRLYRCKACFAVKRKRYKKYRPTKAWIKKRNAQRRAIYHDLRERGIPAPDAKRRSSHGIGIRPRRTA